MIHVIEGRSISHLPGSQPQAATTSITLHVVAAALIAVAVTSHEAPLPMAREPVHTAAPSVTHLVFIAQESPQQSGGGGGGGNRQPAPIRRAEGVGNDRITLRVAKPVSMVGKNESPIAVPELVLDAKPLSQGALDQLGLPFGGVPTGTSLGPGSGGGVGEGVGTGIGPGRGPGYGEGSGGGIGGGVYRPGGSVSAPRVITEVKPTYTDRAMVDHIQGSVVLEMIVRANGVPANLRVVRSLDPGGLDEQAVRAAAQWRFEPGRLNGMPVDVLVILQVDFHLR